MAFPDHYRKNWGNPNDCNECQEFLHSPTPSSPTTTDHIFDDEEPTMPLFERSHLKQLCAVQRMFDPDAWRVAQWESQRKRMFHDGFNWTSKLLLHCAVEIHLFLLQRMYLQSVGNAWTAEGLFVIASDVAWFSFEKILTREEFKATLQLLISTHFLRIVKVEWRERESVVDAADIYLEPIDPSNLRTYLRGDITFKNVGVFSPW